MSREAKELDRAELSRLLKMNPTQLAHYEVGRRLPGCIILYKLCKVLDISADKLLGITNGDNSGSD